MKEIYQINFPHQKFTGWSSFVLSNELIFFHSTPSGQIKLNRICIENILSWITLTINIAPISTQTLTNCSQFRNLGSNIITTNFKANSQAR